MHLGRMTGFAIGVVAAFLIGSIPTGWLLGKMRGIDLREHGSKNIGATNALRVLGKPAGIFCFIVDAGKGLGAVLIAQTLAGPMVDPGLAGVVGAVSGILGHNFTPWLGFKGGKGIATSVGALVALLPAIVPLLLVVWLLVFFTTRYVSLASVAASVALPVFAILQAIWFGGLSPWLLGFACLAGGLAVLRHKSNIQRLLAGTENRFTGKKPAA